MKKLILLSVLTACIFIQSSFAQRTITGTITSADDGMGLPGVSVLAKGTKIRTITDLNGFYSIQVPDSAYSLVFEFMGMETKEAKISNGHVLDISMKSSDIAIDDVVVTAFGIKRSKKSTGYATYNASSGSQSEIKIRGNSSLDGKVSGVQINSPSGFKKIEKKQKNKDIGTDNETYATIKENEFKSVKSNPLSTFSIDVDKASYSNIRRYINNGSKPPKDAVLIEEMINYFSYDYPEPTNEHPIAVYSEIASCPWQADHKLLHIGLQGKRINNEKLPSSNLVFLIDVSGSMQDENKLPLLKQAFKLLVSSLRENDKVSIVVYAGAAGQVLEPTHGHHKQIIIDALDNLQAGGSTAGGAGIQLAYKIAKENFIENGNNRVILATDGDFNVGASSDNEMERLIEERRNDGIFLTCLGFGMGNYKDSKMETLADKGNGNYAYIDNLEEAKKNLVNEFGSTLFTIAKDVKLQIEFNPAKVKSYRLIGYENRLLENEDFNNDAKDAGEMGAGHSVTALYEIIPVYVEDQITSPVDELKYQTIKTNQAAQNSDEMATVKIRYKEPKDLSSVKFVHSIIDRNADWKSCSDSYRFSASVALFGMLLRESEFAGKSDYQFVIDMASGAKSSDDGNYRKEFIDMVTRIKN